MPNVIGKLTDISAASMRAFQPLIGFTLNGVGVTPSSLIASKTLKFPIAADDTFTAPLSITENMTHPADAHYKISIHWLDPDAGMSQVDFPDLKLYVPAGVDLALVDLLPAGTNPLMLYVGDTAPPFTQANMWWIDTSGSGSKLYKTEAN